MNDQITFRFTRKKAFCNCLFSYWVNINGEYVGDIKNGKTLIVSFPRKPKYIVSMSDALHESGMIVDSAADELQIEIITENNAKRGARIALHLADEGGKRCELPDPFAKI